MRVANRGDNQHADIENVPQIPVSRLVGHDEGPITLVRFTADGKYCLTAGSDRTVRLFNPSRLDPAFPPPRGLQAQPDDGDTPVASLPRSLPIQVYEDGIRHIATALAADNDTTRFLVASNQAAVLIDCVSARVLRQFHGHTAVINSVALSGDVLASASYDATVNLWDGRSNSQRPIQTLGDAKDSVTSVSILQPSVRTASVDGCVRTYDIRKGALQCDDYHSPITSMAHSSSTNQDDGVQMLAVSCLDGAICVKHDDANQDSYSTTNNNLQSKIPVPYVCRGGHTAGQYGLECALASDASFVVSGSEDGRAVLYDVAENTSKSNNNRRPQFSATAATAAVAQELIGHSAPTCSVAAHPERKDVVVTASYDGDCVVWASSRDYMRWED